MSARSPTPALTLNESPWTTRPDVLPEDFLAVNPALYLSFYFDITHVDARACFNRVERCLSFILGVKKELLSNALTLPCGCPMPTPLCCASCLSQRKWCRFSVCGLMRFSLPISGARRYGFLRLRIPPFLRHKHVMYMYTRGIATKTQ